MPGPFPLATTAPTISPAGITAPPLEDILASYQASYTNIFGSDVSLDNSTQDGGWLAILARMRNDENNAIISVYLSYSPTFAQGAGLASLVKINGLRKRPSGNSTAPVRIIGVQDTPIPSGVIQDNFGNEWFLSPNVVIPPAGEVTVTATCSQPGDIIPTSFEIVSIIQGWQEANLNGSVAPGAAVEQDAALRMRQSRSTSISAISPKAAISAALGELDNVGRYALYVNDDDVTNALGIPAHFISAVVEGADAIAIATAIARKKSLGAGTYGEVAEIVIDQSGVPDTIRFYILHEIGMKWVVFLSPLASYLTTTANTIAAALNAALEQLPLGEFSYLNKLWAPANLMGDVATRATGLTQGQLDALSLTYNIDTIYQSRSNMVTTAGYPGSTSVIHLASTQNIFAGSRIAILLDDLEFWRATVTVPPSGGNVTFTPAIPSTSTIVNGADVYVFGDIIFAFFEGIASLPPPSGQVKLI